MVRYEKRYWPLAACLAAVAGYVDAVGFNQLGGFFVSFMSGNSTRLAVGMATNAAAARIAASLVGSFVVGVMAGGFVAAASGRHRKAAVLLIVSLILGAAALANRGVGGQFGAFLMAVAMGAENAVFQRDGEVSIGLTYMTGTLVKFGQRLAGAIMGGPRWAWVPYLLLWCSLTLGAITGTVVYVRAGLAAIWVAAGVMALLAIYAAAIGPQRERSDAASSG